MTPSLLHAGCHILSSLKLAPSYEIEELPRIRIPIKQSFSDEKLLSGLVT